MSLRTLWDDGKGEKRSSLKLSQEKRYYKPGPKKRPDSNHCDPHGHRKRLLTRRSAARNIIQVAKGGWCRIIGSVIYTEQRMMPKTTGPTGWTKGPQKTNLMRRKETRVQE